ncbi:DNA-processing protein DprA [Pisciglobus halotolerans]|uniref:DNA processing protein n=1 Tax=Pisciglobus halotolerans TaxID=745365 RepID=A0A1I3BBR7_9LACT|nr:DNA-processing protein DprA [Pisciglobus halotolerans]SFH59748.1 DNA processing protein [Pisciglobus halotolerans]
MLLENLREDIFHLAMCKGVRSGQLLQMVAIKIDDPYCSLTDLCQKAGLTRKNRELFINSYQIFPLEEKLKEHQEKRIGWLTILDPAYPQYLKQIYDPPVILFYQGQLSLLQNDLLSVVGAREHSTYGTSVVKALVPELVQNHLTLVSGLAKGIDQLVHQQTIVHAGHTIAVIGTGLDCYYPFENRSLQKEIAQHQLLLSEYPAGTKPRRAHFPMRNRIIAGLSLGTLVIEAKYRSGSLITAQSALNEGREVFAIPGDIFNPFAVGTNDLIQHGAVCVTTVNDILQNLSKES